MSQHPVLFLSLPFFYLSSFSLPFILVFLCFFPFRILSFNFSVEPHIAVFFQWCTNEWPSISILLLFLLFKKTKFKRNLTFYYWNSTRDFNVTSFFVNNKKQNVCRIKALLSVLVTYCWITWLHCHLLMERFFLIVGNFNLFTLILLFVLFKHMISSFLTI